MSDVRENFLKPLARQFTLPKGATDDPKAWESDYLRSLGSFDDDTLRNAAQALMDIRLTRTFPLVGECNKACKETIEAEAIRQMESGRQQSRRENIPLEEKYPECSERRIHAAYQMMRENSLGKTAADEYWIWGLFDFCCKNKRLPDIHEVKKIKCKSRSVLRDLVAAIGDNTSVENAITMRGNLLGVWVTSYNKHCRSIGVLEITADQVKEIITSNYGSY